MPRDESKGGVGGARAPYYLKLANGTLTKLPYKIEEDQEGKERLIGEVEESPSEA